MANLIKPTVKSTPLSLKSFYHKINRVLIWHDKGGLGDVLMQRMMFEDFKKHLPDCDLVFACLPEYMDAVKDNQYITEVLSSKEVNPDDFCIHYNTCVTIADRYENIKAPCSEHRSDIWAKYCGVDLSNHDMKFNLDQNLIDKCRLRLEENCKNKPILILCPASKMATKTLLKHQIEAIIKAIGDKCHVVVLHNRELKDCTDLGIPGIYDANLKEWMCYLASADYVVSVDTAAFHMAGGLKKPLMGIFTFADGKVYGKYYDFVLVQKHRENGNWDCGPCFTFCKCPKSNKTQKPCLTEISNIELTEGIEKMFNKWKLQSK